MKNLADLVKKLAEKSATDVTTEEFKAILEVAEKLELPEKTDLLSAYILKADAKNDTEIKNHFFAQFGDGFDKNLFESFEEFGLEKSLLEEIKKAEPSSFKRMKTLTSKAKELMLKMADPTTLKGEKADLQKKLDELANERKSLLEVHENEKRQLVELRENDLIKHHLEKEARDFKLIDIPYLDVISGQSILKSLQEHEVKPIFKDGKVVLVNATDPTLSPKDGITIKSVIEKGFANDKLLDLGKSEEKESEEKTKSFKSETPAGSTTFQKNLALAKTAAGVN